MTETAHACCTSCSATVHMPLVFLLLKLRKAYTIMMSCAVSSHWDVDYIGDEWSVLAGSGIEILPAGVQF